MHDFLFPLKAELGDSHEDHTKNPKTIISVLCVTPNNPTPAKKSSSTLFCILFVENNVDLRLWEEKI